MLKNQKPSIIKKQPELTVRGPPQKNSAKDPKNFDFENIPLNDQNASVINNVTLGANFS